MGCKNQNIKKFVAFLKQNNLKILTKENDYVR